MHRLDKDTSGLMVVARTRAAMDALTRAISAHEVSRRYLALAWGRWLPGARQSVDAPIGRDPRNRLRMAVVDLALRPGKTARTDMEGLATDGRLSLVRCSLHTGRTHQIRVHMAAQRHPCVGDAMYGADPALSARLGLTRQWLHAVQLAFAHPATGEWVTFTTTYPEDLQHALDVLRAS